MAPLLHSLRPDPRVKVQVSTTGAASARVAPSINTLRAGSVSVPVVRSGSVPSPEPPAPHPSAL